MTVVTELANGNNEIFTTDNYIISKSKDFHPLLVKVTIYDNGKKLKSVKRPFKFFYKHFTFKSEKVQNELKRIEEQRKNKEK